MGKQASETFSSLRDLIKEHGQAVYNFCDYMLPREAKIESVLMDSFVEFGDLFRKQKHRTTDVTGNFEMRIRLFSIAWSHIQRTMREFQFVWSPGRDTRPSRRSDENLLIRFHSQKGHPLQDDSELVERLKLLDPEFRAPVVLRDILRLEEEEVLRILGLRWGVYRHRLHRGRLEFKDGLKGHTFIEHKKGSQPTV